MRTFSFLFLFALVLGVVVAFVVGFVNVASEHPDGKYIVTFTVHTEMLWPASTATSPPGGVIENKGDHDRGAP